MGLLNAGDRKKHKDKRSTHRAGKVDVSTSLAMMGAATIKDCKILTR
jgi:hypothetical protein